MEVIEMIAEGMDRGYEDEFVEALYIAKDSFGKLEKIEQIVEAYTTDDPREPMYDTEDYMNSIIEVLDKE